MSKNNSQADSPVSTLKNEAARKRWELFHLAIAHAKKSNLTAMQDAETSTADTSTADTESASPLLSVVQ
jgi:hypothetical protein